MNVNDYIRQLFLGFNIRLNDAALLTISHYTKIEGDKLYEEELFDKIIYGILLFAPFFMLSPLSYSISENGHSKSLSWEEKSFLKWYSYYCKMYGLKDELNTDKPKVTFL